MDKQLSLPFFNPPRTLSDVAADPTQHHVLVHLKFPDRFEEVESLLGPRVADLLVEPDGEVLTVFRVAAQHSLARGEGQFIPLAGPTGVGKTTLATCLNAFLPDYFTQTATHEGPIEVQSMSDTVSRLLESMPSAPKGIIPVLIDHREGSPPNPSELSAIKQFLRKPHPGSSCALMWPEVEPSTATTISRSFQNIAGRSAIQLPVLASGPPKNTWQQIAVHTLELANGIPALGELGVDPTLYDPSGHGTLGEFLRAISIDFTRNLVELLQSTQMPINLVVCFVSESLNADVLSSLTSGTRYGLLDSSALISATPNSEIGRWWTGRRGRLTQTVLKLNARCFCVPPAAATAVLHRYGPDDVKAELTRAGKQPQAPSQVRERLLGSDLGRYLANAERGVYETRGAPPRDAQAQLKAVSDIGYTYGNDKPLNRAMAMAIEDLLRNKSIEFESVGVEKGLGFVPLIPDVAVLRANEAICLEFTWRAGEFLRTAHRSDVAQYILTKLRNYARELGWIRD